MPGCGKHQKKDRHLNTPCVMTEEAVTDMAVTEQSRQAVAALLPPKSLLAQADFPMPEPIHPLLYPSFASLFAVGNRIRNLELVPVKSDEQYAYYHSFSKEQLTEQVRRIAEQSPLTFAPNQFPYFLPEDVAQWIVWLQVPTIPDERLLQFLVRVLTVKGISTENVILFERPLQTTALLVRGTIPAYRHLHVWFPQ